MFQSRCKYSKWVCICLGFFFLSEFLFHLLSVLQGKGWEVKYENRLGAEAGLHVKIEYLNLLESTEVILFQGSTGKQLAR